MRDVMNDFPGEIERIRYSIGNDWASEPAVLSGPPQGFRPPFRRSLLARSGDAAKFYWPLPRRNHEADDRASF